jgi:hypothetical protein
MRWNLKLVISWIAGTSLVGLVIIYAYLKSAAIITGPTISMISPLHGESTSTALISVTGTVTNSKEITLDGRPIFIDLSGKFREKLLLTPGYNIIEVVAGDVQGRKVREAIALTYVPIDETATTTSRVSPEIE